jgi:hypothetical protein
MGTLTFQAAAGGSLNLLGPNIAGTVNLTLPTADGTNGQPLQTNGSGTLSFANLGTAAGGTGLTSFTSTGIPYASSTSALTTGSALTFDGTNLATTGSFNSTNTFGFKNRIINGAMVIDQRNAGAAVTVNAASDFYACDRFSAIGQSADGVFTIQQSTTAPTGFKNSILATVTTADSSIGATQFYIPVRQKIEGFNVADLGWGTASAATVTLSFWVRCSVTGTFGGAITNNTQTRSYPFTYTISAANTFEQKTITIAGDTTGTWVTNNGNGIDIIWSIGMGSTYLGTAGAWAGTSYFSATGATNLISTNGATFYITGVQLEKGSTATSFDFRSYGTELALCQRYYQGYSAGFVIDTASAFQTFPLPVTMRATPTLTGTSIGAGYTSSNNTNISLSQYQTTRAQGSAFLTAEL